MRIATEKPKRRRQRGSGSVYRPGGSKIYWISYRGADGKRRKESTGSTLKTAADLLLQKRNGSVIHKLPLVKHAEKLSFADAAQAVIDDTTVNFPKSLRGLTVKLERHLRPYFGMERMAGLDAGHIVGFIAHRQKQGITAHKGPRNGQRIGNVSNAEINRELAILGRMFSLAIEQGRIAMKPFIPKLTESSARSGFFEREQYESVLAHLPEEIRPVITFAYITGWRVSSEILPLEWRNVDFKVGEVRIDAGASKNRAPRVFPFTDDLRALLEARKAEHDALKKVGHLIPNVFWRMVAEGRGGVKKPRAITTFDKSWKLACKLAGCPGRIPHDLRRTAVRNLVRVGIPQSVAMKMSGHKTASVFSRYNITSDSDLREAAAKMNAATKLNVAVG